MSAPNAPLVVSLGDPAGVGPEIIAQAWKVLRRTDLNFAVLGDQDLLARLAPVAAIETLADACDTFPAALPVLHRPVGAPVEAGRSDPAHARAILSWIEEGVSLSLSGQAAGLVTAPIAKAPLYQAGFQFPGHTEYLADLTAKVATTGPRGPIMLLATDALRVALATIHIPLAKVPAALSSSAIVQTGRVLHYALRSDFGVPSPRLALAGLNPHAGEGGAIGREEIDIINPAAAQLRAEGVDCTDAKPADSLFHADARGTYDGVIGLYHDQALIPIKTLDFWGGVNATLGLPIVRTSPDHGVGYDIAGKGVARADSLIASLRLARQMAQNRAAYREAGR